MRFDHLDILRYGAFSDRRLVFRPDAKLHIVYGPNEAGKSSALSAISDLLFGFPERSDYGFLHDTGMLRVGAQLRSRDGQALSFRRRKGRKNTLLAHTEGEEPLPEDALAPFLGTLNRDVFERAFGLDSGTLRAGGQMMLKSGGEIGSLLFSAASGLTGLSSLRKTLDGDADAIFSPRRSKDRRFYQVLDAHEAARRAERENELRSADWKKLTTEEAELAAELRAVQAAREHTKRTLDRLRRLMRLEPIIREIDRERAQLAGFADLSGLPEEFAERLAARLEQRRRQEDAREAAEAELARLADEIAQLTVDDALIAAAPKINAAHAEKGAYSKAREDLARVNAEVDEFNQRLSQTARRLGYADALALERAEPADADLARLRELADEGAALDRDLKQLKRRLEEEQDALRRLRQDAGQGRLIDPKPWADKLAALRPDIAELSALEAVTVRVARAGNDMAVAAGRLDPPISDATALVTAALPDPATLASQRQAIDAAHSAKLQAQQALKTLQGEWADLRDQRAVLEGTGRIITRDMVVAAREERDALVDQLEAKPVASAWPALKDAVLRADELADDSLADAERSSRLSQLALRQRELEHAVTAAQAEAKEAEIAHSDAVTEFEDLFRHISITVLSPDRMIEWRRGVDQILRLAAAYEDAKDELEALRLKEEQLRPALVTLAEAIGLTVGTSPLRSLSREIERRLEEITGHWSEYRSLERMKKAAEDTEARLLQQESELRAAAEHWRIRFLGAAAGAGLPEDATVEMANAAIDAWRTVPSLILERENRMRRVRGMSRDMERFERDVDALRSQLAPDLSGLPADVAISLLSERMSDARDALNRRATLDATLQRAQTLHARLQAEVEAVNDELAALAGQAAVDVADLPSLLRDLGEKAHLERVLNQCRARYVEHADGASEDEVRSELADFDRIAAAVEIDGLELEDERQVERLRALGVAQANVDRRRHELEAGVGAERAVFEKLAAEQEARVLARRWVVLKLAGSLLAQSMEAYRERQADPVMKRAGEVFCNLTGGRFTRIVQVYDETDELQLAVERVSGEQVPLHGLSEGTGDQLYLALRLAFLEDYSSRNEPAPLVLDDIFQTFDDERTAAGLRTLASAGETFQTILFTHQMSLVDAARRELGQELDLVKMSGV
jgi:uncharacterized protein YhaN